MIDHTQFNRAYLHSVGTQKIGESSHMGYNIQECYAAIIELMI